MKKILKVFLVLIFSGFYTNNIAQTYSLTVDNKPYVFLQNPQSAVVGPWDDPEFHLPIGFEFEYFDILSDHLHSYPNSLGGYTSFNQDEDHLYMLIHFFADLIDIGYQQDSSVSKIYYKTEGPAGQRVFTLEYNNAGLLGGLETENGIFLDYINVQIRLYEGSGDIELHYGPNSIHEEPEIVFDPFTGPLVGLLADVDNEPGGDRGETIFLQGDALSPIVVTDTTAWLDWPILEGTLYRFSRMNTSTGDYLPTAKPFLLFPNPTSGYIKLKDNLVNDIIYPIIVTDTQGKQVELWNAKDEISVATLPAGCYYIIFNTHSEVFSQILIVIPK